MTGSHSAPPRTIVFISQVYVPDPAAVGQQMADAAAELARRGHRVIVYTSRRGYEDPSAAYPSRETVDGVEVRRVPLSSFGKRSIVVRLLGGILFTLQALARALFVPGLDTVVVSTSPPMASFAGVVLRALRRVRLTYWIMDLNPDQLVAVGAAAAGSLPVRALDWLNRLVLRSAQSVVVLDRFMAERVNVKVDVRRKLAVIPPWPHEEVPETVPHDSNPFRQRHGLQDKFVVMYSGNHAPSNPLDTLLAAARRLASEPRLAFVFVGGGLGKREVEAAAREVGGILSLPYEPMAGLRHSLSAADVHVVSVGDAVVGIVHPCKAYGAMGVARPLLLLGPDPCHVSDLIADHDLGWHVAHGDVDGAVRALRAMLDAPRAELAAKGDRARALVGARLSRRHLCGRFCDVVERGVAGAPGTGAVAAAPAPFGQVQPR